MENISILWVDDEIDHLRPHIIFLEQKGFKLDTATNGMDALDKLREKRYDLVFLDENMPGLSGLETLQELKNIQPLTPVIMITKSEEESIMEDAIGSKIADYLIKPVNPNQILLSIKKNLDTNRLVSEKTTSNYQQEFRKISMELMNVRDYEAWIEMYKKLVFWELELEDLQDTGLREILNSQKQEANNLFCRFIEREYQDWLDPNQNEKPVLSQTAFRTFLPKEVSAEKPVFLFMIDNMRYDQWKVIEKEIQNDYRTVEENMYFSILPTATQYARNAFFAGLMPLEIEKKYPDKWVDENDEGSKNSFEDFFLGEQLKRLGKSYKFSYNKVIKLDFGRKLARNIKDLLSNPLNIIVYNFVDMLSHAKTEMEVIRELAEDDRAFRNLTLTWFKNSPLNEMLKNLKGTGAQIIFTTDHGTVNVDNPLKVVGDRNTTSNLRYKHGKNLSYNPKEVFEVRNPKSIQLPSPNVSTSYIFAKENDFFAYPNNYNHYVTYYRNTFQHGGISLEEVIIPWAVLEEK
jgi:CheY-like chemotaxis protein